MPAIEFASTTTTPEDNPKAAQRMRSECNGVLQEAVASQIKLVDSMVAFSKAKADKQHAEASSEIRAVMIVALGTSIAAIGLVPGIGVFGIARPMRAPWSIGSSGWPAERMSR